MMLSIVICILVLIVFCICMHFIFGGYTPSKVIRGIDKALSKSHFSQVFILAFFIVFSFAFIVSLSTVVSPILDKGSNFLFWSALSHFFNPGSFDRADGISNPVKLTLNVFGMILMTGLLISVLSNILERRVDKVKNGQIGYKFKKHIVIIGYNQMTASLVKQLSEKFPRTEIVLQTIQEVPSVRHELFSQLEKKIEKNVSLLSGNRNSMEDLVRLRLARSIEIYILGESDEYDHDSLTIECFKKINTLLIHDNILQNKPCHLLFDNQSTYSVLQQQDILENSRDAKLEPEVGVPVVVGGQAFFVSAISPDKGVVELKSRQGHREKELPYEEVAALMKRERPLRFIPFNFQELWAKKVFVDNKYHGLEEADEGISYLPLDRGGIAYESDKTVHLVVLGMSKMGVALGVQATHLCHYPNVLRDRKLKTKITFVDENADREMYFLQGRYRHLFDEIDYSFEDTGNPGNNMNNLNNGESVKFSDVEWHFIKGRVENPVIRQKLVEYSAGNTHLTIAVCLNLPAAAIAAGLYLPGEIYTRDVQVLVKQDAPYSILSMLKTSKRYKNVKPFGMLNNCLDLQQNDDLLARRVYYVYSYYFDGKTNGEIPVVIPDREAYDARWDNILVAEKWSNRYHADMIHAKLRSLDKQKPFAEQVEIMAMVEHNRWNIEKLLIGYRPTTTREDEELEQKRTTHKELKSNFIHKDIKPYIALEESTKEIDRMISKSIFLIKGGENEKV